MTADHFWLCLHLDGEGRPCNRRTMKPLSFCSLHKDAKPQKRKGRRQTNAYQRSWYAKRAAAGALPGTEAA